MACVQRLAAPRPRCLRCALPLGSSGQHCADCRRDPPPFERCHTLGDYGYPWDGLITAFKFHGRFDLAGPLAGALADRLAEEAVEPADLVLPVPLSPARLRERGHNQAWEVARRVAAARGLPADPHCLRRLRDTAHQVGLSRRERAANLRDAFWVPPEYAPRVQHRRVALLDDVLTTGVTAAAASRALLAAGATHVQLWVLARTPSPADADD